MQRVLIVDDAIVVHFILTHVLTQAGYEVAGVAEDGERAIEMLRSIKPDIVLLDIGIPKKDGIEVLQVIKAEAPSARVVICSAVRLDQRIEEAMQLGADGYVVKPIDPGHLLSLLSQFTDKAA